MKFLLYCYLVLNLYEVYSEKIRYVIISKNMICTSWTLGGDMQWTNHPSTSKEKILFQLPPSYLQDNSWDAHVPVYFYPHRSSLLPFEDESLLLHSAETLKHVPPFYGKIIPNLKQIVHWTDDVIPKIKPVLKDVSENARKSKKRTLFYKPIFKVRWHLDKSVNEDKPEIVPETVLTKCSKKPNYHCIEKRIGPEGKPGNAVILNSEKFQIPKPNIKWIAKVNRRESKIELYNGSELILSIKWYLDNISGPKIAWILDKNQLIKAQIRCFETRENGKYKITCMIDRNEPPVDLSEFNFGKNVTLEPTYKLKWFINSDSSQLKWLMYKSLNKGYDKNKFPFNNHFEDNDHITHWSYNTLEVNQPSNEVSVLHKKPIFRPYSEKHETYQKIETNDNATNLDTSHDNNWNVHWSTNKYSNQADGNPNHDSKNKLSVDNPKNNQPSDTSVGLSIGGSLKLKNPLTGLLPNHKDSSGSSSVGLSIGGALKYKKPKVESTQSLGTALEGGLKDNSDSGYPKSSLLLELLRRKKLGLNPLPWL